MPRQKMSAQIEILKTQLANEESRHRAACAKILELEKRHNEIAAENESLRQDKKWLQTMHSCLLQSLHQERIR